MAELEKAGPKDTEGEGFAAMARFEIDHGAGTAESRRRDLQARAAVDRAFEQRAS
jgi:hypothetical protein